MQSIYNLTIYMKSNYIFFLFILGNALLYFYSKGDINKAIIIIMHNITVITIYLTIHAYRVVF